MKIKTIDIQAKEWFDRTYGNSYFSARITLNFGMKNEKTIYLPFQYGYGDHYVYEALKEIYQSEEFTLWRVREILGVIVNYDKQEKCLKREVIAWGQED